MTPCASKETGVKKTSTVCEMTKGTERERQRFEEEKTEETSLQGFPKNSQWRRRRDVLRQCFAAGKHAATENARSATVDGWVRRATSDDDEAETRRRRALISFGRLQKCQTLSRTQTNKQQRHKFVCLSVCLSVCRFVCQGCPSYAS